MQSKIEKIVKKKESQKETGAIVSKEITSIMDKHKLDTSNTKELMNTADAAFEDYKKKYEKSKEVVDPLYEPVGQSVLTTATLMSIEESGKWLTNNAFSIGAIKQVSESLSDVQTVIAVGPACQQVKPGDTIQFNQKDFIRVKNPNSVKAEEVDETPVEFINVDGEVRAYLYLHERNIKFIKRNKS